MAKQNNLRVFGMDNEKEEILVGESRNDAMWFPIYLGDHGEFIKITEKKILYLRELNNLEVYNGNV